MFCCHAKLNAMITVYSYRNISTPLRTVLGFHSARLKELRKKRERNERSADRPWQTRFIDAETASHPVFA